MERGLKIVRSPAPELAGSTQRNAKASGPLTDSLEVAGGGTPSMTPALAASYAYCERLARRQAANFYHAFRVLPWPQRRAMCALYAFLRVADDLTDGPGIPAEKQAALSAWRSGFQQAMAGDYSHPLHAALHHTVRIHAIPGAYINAVLDGV